MKHGVEVSCFGKTIQISLNVESKICLSVGAKNVDNECDYLFNKYFLNRFNLHFGKRHCFLNTRILRMHLFYTYYAGSCSSHSKHIQGTFI